MLSDMRRIRCNRQNVAPQGDRNSGFVIGRMVTELLLKQGKAVRAMVRNEGSQMIQNTTPSPQQRQHWLSANVCLIHQ